MKTEISRLWNTQTAVIPIVRGATGVVAKSINTYLENLDTTIDITILQKQVAIHSSTIISKVLGDTVFINNTNTQEELAQNEHQTPNNQKILS